MLMLRWKIYAVFILVFGTIGTLFTIPQCIGDPMGFAGALLFPFSVTAVWGYAFFKPLWPGRHWYWFANLYSVWLAAVFGIFLVSAHQLLNDAPGNPELVGSAIGTALGAAMIFINRLGVWRYGQMNEFPSQYTG
jgi:hypothetical protein